MPTTSKYTKEQRRGFALIAQKEGRDVASKKAKVSTTTISHWAKSTGVKLTSAPPGKVAKKRAAKKRAATAMANGASTGNGHAPRGIEAPGLKKLDRVRDQLLGALGEVEAMRTAFRQAFG